MFKISCPSPCLQERFGAEVCQVIENGMGDLCIPSEGFIKGLFIIQGLLRGLLRVYGVIIDLLLV